MLLPSETKRAQGRGLGRPRVVPAAVAAAPATAVRLAAAAWSVSKSTALRWIQQGHGGAGATEEGR